MAYTPEQIKNLTLIEINHETVQDWADSMNTDIPIINAQYDLHYPIALSLHPWSFATKYAKLNTSDVAAGFSSRYKKVVDLPSDCLGNISVFFTEEMRAVMSFYEVIGNKLYTNQNSIYIRYTSQVSEDLLPPYYINWFKVYFALQLNDYLNGDMQRKQLLERNEPLIFRSAKSMDAKQNPNESKLTNPLLEVRATYGGIF